MTQLEHNKSVEHLRTEVECYQRIVGYIRPVSSANVGKQAEIGDRVMFNLEGVK